MNTAIYKAKAARHDNGQIIVSMSSGIELSFPIMQNARLAGGTPAQLNNIEISPFGLHWPDLDEDLSFRGIFEGDFGQKNISAP